MNRRQFPLTFLEDASRDDILYLLEGQLAETLILQYPENEDSSFSYPSVKLNLDGWIDEPTEV